MQDYEAEDYAHPDCTRVKCVTATPAKMKAAEWAGDLLIVIDVSGGRVEPKSMHVIPHLQTLSASLVYDN